MSTSLIRDLDPAFRSLFEHNKDAVYSFDLYGKFTSLNRATESISGYSSAELIGSSFALLITKEDLPKVQAIFQKACEGTSQSYETSIYNKSGEVVYLSVTNIPAIVGGEIVGVFGIARDISKEVTLTQRLQQSEEKYRLIAENCSDMIRTFDKNGTITYASPSHLRILGYTQNEYEGKNCLDFVHTEDHALCHKILRQMARTKQRNEWQIRLRRKNGEWAWLELHGQVVCNNDGSIKQFVVVSSDITEKKNNELTLHHLAFHDPLTGLMNRRAFLERLQYLISDNPNKMFTVLFLDCDKFKTINDTFGHNFGDLVLCEFARRIQQTVPDHSSAYRFAGDEFTIILENPNKTVDSIKFAKTVLGAIRAEWNIENHRLFVTSSIGIACFPSDGSTVEKLIEQADNAMYASKEQGGNTYMKAGSIQRAVSQ